MKLNKCQLFFMLLGPINSIEKCKFVSLQGKHYIHCKIYDGRTAFSYKKYKQIFGKDFTDKIPFVLIGNP